MPVLAWCLRMLCALLLVAVTPARADEPIVLRVAGFAQANGPSLPVPLPDTWAQRDLPVHGSGRYTLRFVLDAAPERPWAVAFTRIGASRRVLLNGVAIEEDREGGAQGPVGRVIDLPAPLLRAGENTLVVEVAYRFRGGLSSAVVGPAAALEHAAQREALWKRELPRSLNMGMALLAVFLLLLSWRRPSERSTGLFGAFALLGSVRNYSYLTDIGVLSSPASDWFFFSAQVWANALFAAFALSLHTARAPGRIERAIVVASIAVPAAAALAMPFIGLGPVRAVAYPLLLAVAASSLVVVGQAMRREPTRAHRALVLGFGAIIAASAHDYAYHQGHLPVTDMFWVPVVSPFALGLYGLLLLERFVRATAEVARLNVELEHRVQQRTHALRAANAAKTRFLASASHDLRQPVAAIGLMVGLLREQVATPTLRTLVDRIDEAMAAMEELLKGLLDLSRLEAGTAPLRLQPVAVQALFDAIASHETEAAARKGLRLRFRPTGLAVRSDPLLLEQVLRNLVSNAVRYTPRGGVLVAARVRGDRVLLQVWDTGIGIAQSEQASVFDEFVQLDNAARESARGFGLGLSIVRRSAQRLGHPLGLRSVLGRGSCFSLMAPRATGAAPAVMVERTGTTPLHGLRIVLVEDDPVMRETLGERLRVWGAEVRAFDGVSSLRAALPPRGTPKDGRFTDLLITDQRLPGGSGILVIELVRQHCGATRAMVVTGDTAPEDIALLESTGVPVLHKPFRAEALLETIGKALRSTPLGELPG